MTDFTNINDPAGISALLARLRESQTWSEIQAGAPASREAQQTVKQAPPPQEAALPASSVATLLSQLSSSIASTADASPEGAPLCTNESNEHLARNETRKQPHASSPFVPVRAAHQHDARAFSFQQSLPYIARLSDDPSFIEAANELKRDQEVLEKALWKERQALHNKHIEKVKTAVTKANMLGTGLSEREATIMKQVFERELQQFDRERVIPAWDGLISRQQRALESLGVPTMFPTDSNVDRDRQQRVIQVLEGVINSEPAGSAT